jgi:hypothetical protein
MPVNFDADEFATALRQVKQAKPVPHGPASGTPLSTEEWQQSEEFRVRVISSRAKLKLMRDRSDALRDSLQRFRSQQQDVLRA